MNLFRMAAVLAAAATLAGLSRAQNYCFKVTVTGKGKPVIFIPGLTCGGDVWNATVGQLRSKYECHVLSLPGFAGQPPIQGPYLTRVRDDIIAYVKDQKLDHPSLVGHSLGGTLVLMLGESEPTLWGHLVSVDGLPFLALAYYPAATADSMKLVSQQISQKLSTATPELFRASIHADLAAGLSDPKLADAVFTSCGQSDQATVAEAVKEVLTTDLRPNLNRIQSPLLLIVAGKQTKNDAEKKKLTEVYQTQLKGAKNARLEMDWNALHYVMLDDPKGFITELEAFLGS